MVRLVVTAFAASVLVCFVAGCSGHDASVGDTSGTSDQKLQTKKDGSATGDGKTCSWEDTTTLDTCASPKAPVPGYALGDEFKSIDGCNECACTAKGIMCTVRKCGGDPGTVPPSPPDGDGTVCTADAKKCPDGTWTKRVGPKCDFYPCGGDPVPPSPPVACDASLRICKDGSPAKPYEDTCKQVCPEDFGTGGGSGGGDPGGTVCPAIARICKDNIPAKQDPNTCKELCPEDFPTPNPAPAPDPGKKY